MLPTGSEVEPQVDQSADCEGRARARNQPLDPMIVTWYGAVVRLA
jgi:hypothetical protein